MCHISPPPGTNRYFRKIAAEVGLDVSFADLTKLEELKAALKPNTKVHLAEKADFVFKKVSQSSFFPLGSI